MAKSVMIQGTMSNVGKSLICAALCRIFKQDGYTVAPFKSQNMALNSFITRDGDEIGRAQAMQAEAAGIEPTVLINPVLLKPTTNVGSQVIINGKSIGNMHAAEYFKYKKKLVPTILKAYNKLAEQVDIIVIEGAGSPTEMNLKVNDIVNMGLAELIDAPVLLVGDIDRGGIFAQLIGTIDLLESHEKQRIKGLIINKFRGDQILFNNGIRIFEEKTGKPILGIVPYINCDIDDEDSLSNKFSYKSSKSSCIIKIAVIRLPKISNFTDFEPFRQYKDVAVCYINKVTELNDVDMIIVPGSKSTIADMKWLRNQGFEETIKEKARLGTPVFGICGGYQMLGKKIADPGNTEGGGEITGINLLNVTTVFSCDKIQRQSCGVVIANSKDFPDIYGTSVSGYEIHMGETISSEAPFICFSDGRIDGSIRKNVIGTYLHGVFDNKEMSYSIVSELFHRKGLDCEITVDRRTYLEMQYDMLSNEVRKNINMAKIYEFLKL